MRVETAGPFAGNRRSADPALADGPEPDRFHVSFICSGNICRSPIGEQMLRAALDEAGLTDSVRVSSAGTGDWHVGQPANSQARAALQRAGLASDHRAHQITAAELRTIDLVLAADRGHLRVLRRLADDPAKVRLLRSFDPDADSDEVPDPYQRSDRDFDAVISMTAAAVPGVLQEIRRQLR